MEIDGKQKIIDNESISRLSMSDMYKKKVSPEHQSVTCCTWTLHVQGEENFGCSCSSSTTDADVNILKKTSFSKMFDWTRKHVSNAIWSLNKIKTEPKRKASDSFKHLYWTFFTTMIHSFPSLCNSFSAFSNKNRSEPVVYLNFCFFFHFEQLFIHFLVVVFPKNSTLLCLALSQECFWIFFVDHLV